MVHILSAFTAIVEDIYPILHAKLIHKLSERNYTQTTIAQYLGITQAMVSKYFSKSYALPKQIDRELEVFALHITAEIEQGATREHIASLITQKTVEWVQTKLFSPIICKKFRLNHFTIQDQKQQDHRQQVLTQLKKVAAILESENLSHLCPQVRSNIAFATPKPQSEQDIAAVPGRFIPVNGKLKAPASAEFGASKHLASLLIELSEKNPGIRSIMNITYNQSVNRALKKQGLTYIDLSKAAKAKNVDCIVDRGGFGREPNCYILGKDANEVLAKVLKIK